MLIEDTSTFRINHPAYISLLLKSGPSDEEKNNSVSHEDREEDMAQERCPETWVEIERREGRG